MVESYDILFTVGFRHTYYKDGLCPAFEVRPDMATNILLKKGGMIFRKTKTGFVVLTSSNKINNDIFLGGKTDKHQQLNFLLYLNDAGFLNITDTDDPGDSSVRLYTNQQVSPGENQDNSFIFVQGKNAFMSTDYFNAGKDNAGNVIFEKNGTSYTPDPVEGRDSIFNTKGLDKGIYSINSQDGPEYFYLYTSSLDLKPFAVISMDIDNENITDNDGKLKRPVFNLQFETKQTYWQYIINHNLANGNLVVELSDSSQEFERSEGPVSENNAIIIFTSKQAISITESREEYFRLKLRNGDPSNDQVLISKLPLPGKDVLNKTIEGKAYSPIYVNF